MLHKILIVAIIAIIVSGATGFFVYQKFSQQDQPDLAANQNIGEVSPISSPTVSSSVSPSPSPKISATPTVALKITSTPTASAPAKTSAASTPSKLSSPVDSLTAPLISKWGADCKNKGNEQAIADCILDWQENNIHWCYTNPSATTYFDYFEPDYPDCVVDMQFQQMSPNSFPVSKVMDLKIRSGKIFGACYTYATTYCAVARWNGLKCRVMEAKTAISFYSASSGDYAAGYCGSAPQTFLDKLSFSCSEWRKKNWATDADHYWAEIFINGAWKIMEKPLWAYMHDTSKNIIQVGRSYGDTGW